MYYNKYGGSENHHLLATLPKWYLDGLPKHKKHKINIKNQTIPIMYLK